MEKKENKRTHTQLKMTSFKQVCLMCMLIFMLCICNCYYDAYTIAKKDGKQEDHRTNIQVKIISFKQVCSIYMLIFMLFICNCYYGAYKIAKKDGKRRNSSNKYLNQNDVI